MRLASRAIEVEPNLLRTPATGLEGAFAPNGQTVPKSHTPARFAQPICVNFCAKRGWRLSGVQVGPLGRGFKNPAIGVGVRNSCSFDHFRTAGDQRARSVVLSPKNGQAAVVTRSWRLSTTCGVHLACLFGDP